MRAIRVIQLKLKLREKIKQIISFYETEKKDTTGLLEDIKRYISDYEIEIGGTTELLENIKEYIDDCHKKEGLDELKATHQLIDFIIHEEVQGDYFLEKIIELQNSANEDFNNKNELQKNNIGLRIRYLAKRNNQNLAEVARNAGISRATINRSASGLAPKKTSLQKIIVALHVSEYDFCKFPSSYEKWEDTYNNHIDIENDIFAFRDRVLSELESNTFTYRCNNRKTIVSNKYFQLLKTLVTGAFKSLDLIQHDGQRKEPEFYFGDEDYESNFSEDNIRKIAKSLNLEEMKYDDSISEIEEDDDDF